MALSKGRSFSYLEEREAEGNPNEGLPASEAVAGPTRLSPEYRVSAGFYEDLQDVKVSLGYLHAVNPETGAEVVFVPGEALPEWARQAQKTLLQPSPSPDKQPAKGKGQRSVKAQMGENEA